jgi:hypothetical protein
MIWFAIHFVLIILVGIPWLTSYAIALFNKCKNRTHILAVLQETTTTKLHKPKYCFMSSKILNICLTSYIGSFY